MKKQLELPRRSLFWRFSVSFACFVCVVSLRNCSFFASKSSCAFCAVSSLWTSSVRASEYLARRGSDKRCNIQIPRTGSLISTFRIPPMQSRNCPARELLLKTPIVFLSFSLWRKQRAPRAQRPTAVPNQRGVTFHGNQSNQQRLLSRVILIETKT